MKFKKIIIAVMTIAAATIGITSTTVKANDEYVEMEATAYCDEGLCYDETVPMQGITVAAAKEYIGKTFVIYDENWTLIGIYECRDTGGDYRIKNGTVVGIYIDSEYECIQFGRQKVHVKIVDAKG